MVAIAPGQGNIERCEAKPILFAISRPWVADRGLSAFTIEWLVIPNLVVLSVRQFQRRLRSQIKQITGSYLFENYSLYLLISCLFNFVLKSRIFSLIVWLFGNSRIIAQHRCFMQLSIFAITISRGSAPKNCPHPGAFALLLLSRGGDLLGNFWGAGICRYTIFAIFGIFIIMARIGDWQHFGVYLLLWNFIRF